MQYFTIKAYPELKAQALTDEEIASIEEKQEGDNTDEPKKGAFLRFLDSILDGGKDGVAIGVAIIPGVLVISTMVMMLTFGPAGNDYSGAAYEGYPALPWLADKVDFIFKWLFGFEHPELIAFPITSLGAVGAALGLVPGFIAKGIIDANAIAVFTAMGMCWSGFLSTHTAMLDSMGYRKLISKAILSHTIAGLCAGIIAHWTMVLIQLI